VCGRTFLSPTDIACSLYPTLLLQQARGRVAIVVFVLVGGHDDRSPWNRTKLNLCTLILCARVLPACIAMTSQESMTLETHISGGECSRMSAE
jgi:hypothetical protein